MPQGGDASSLCKYALCAINLGIAPYKLRFKLWDANDFKVFLKREGEFLKRVRDFVQMRV